jgi:hypothetical protein
LANDVDVALVEQWSQQVRMVCVALVTTPVNHVMVRRGSQGNIFETVLQIQLEYPAARQLWFERGNGIE